MSEQDLLREMQKTHKRTVGTIKWVAGVLLVLFLASVAKGIWIDSKQTANIESMDKSVIHYEHFMKYMANYKEEIELQEQRIILLEESRREHINPIEFAKMQEQLNFILHEIELLKKNRYGILDMYRNNSRGLDTFSYSKLLES